MRTLRSAKTNVQTSLLRTGIGPQRSRRSIVGRRRSIVETLEPRQMLSAVPQLANLGDVFYIDTENHNLTQPTPGNGTQQNPDQLLGNPAAPYLNSLITPGNSNAAQTAYAGDYLNASYLSNGKTVYVHPSEPNYVWQEAGLAGPLNDNDPYPSNIVNDPNLSALLQTAGISWKSYQEDIDLTASSGSVNQPGANALTSTVAPQSQWTVPLESFSGTSSGNLPAYTNPYNLSHQYFFAAKHDGQLFFTATNGSTSSAPDFLHSNPEVSHYAPLQQLQTDLNNSTVARYTLITPDIYNDMHSALTGGFSYHGTAYTDDQAAIAQGDNFLSKIIPKIEASQAYKNSGVIVIRFDETEGGNSTQYTIPEIIISPAAKGNAYKGTQVYTHSSDLKTMEEVFGVTAPGGGFLGDANAQGTNDLADLFKALIAKGSTFSTTEGHTFSGTVATFGDADLNTLTSDYSAKIVWGDGTTSAGKVTTAAGGSFAVTGSHVYAEEGKHTVTVTVTDVDGSSATALGTAKIADAPLKGKALTITPTAGATFSGAVATFTDADPKGAISDYSAKIVWGDGTTSTGTVTTALGGGFAVTGSHLYTAAATDTVVVTITDTGGSKATADSTAKIGNSSLSAVRAIAARDALFAQLDS